MTNAYKSTNKVSQITLYTWIRINRLSKYPEHCQNCQNCRRSKNIVFSDKLHFLIPFDRFPSRNYKIFINKPASFHLFKTDTLCLLTFILFAFFIKHISYKLCYLLLIGHPLCVPQISLQENVWILDAFDIYSAEWAAQGFLSTKSC